MLTLKIQIHRLHTNPPKPRLVKDNFPHKDKIMSFMHEFIEKVVYVAGDDHCGFRAAGA